MRLDPGESEDRAPDLTPLIDMVFLLLVFFLASTTFAKEEVELDLTLPEARSGSDANDGHLMVINVGRDGGITVNGRELTMEGLRQRLASTARRNKEQEILIRGDTDVAYGVVQNVFDACRSAALTRVSLGAKPWNQGGGE